MLQGRNPLALIDASEDVRHRGSVRGKHEVHHLLRVVR
jgi:hypothetical protein